MHALLEKLWYRNHFLATYLKPFSWLYSSICKVRRFFLELRQKQFPIPIIVVGNLTTGGVGKTPLVVALAKALEQKGLSVGVVSRGYKATLKTFPYLVTVEDKASDVGDEPLLIARSLNVPVVIAPKRVEAVEFLLKKYACDIIISDDGLQHYAMGRSIEIIVIDGFRELGNGLCFPAGPLRESPKRLKEVDFVVVNTGLWPDAYNMSVRPTQLRQVATGVKAEMQDLKFPIAAVAGVGNPARFFCTLKVDMDLIFTPYIFPNHHAFQESDLQLKEQSIIMTEKDAVKCQPFAKENWYYLQVEASLIDSFWQALWSHKQLRSYLK
jgi:tetraacyldisaccharide 4'-kinase